MMATVPMSSSSLLSLLRTLEDDAAGVSEQTDAYLTIANRLSGEDGRQFFPLILKHFPRLGKAFQTHISTENEELSQAALQALGFCVFNTNIVSGIPVNFAEEILLTLCALVLKATDKNTCTRALWVISKQNFTAEVVVKKTPEILKTLEALQTKDIQSVLTDHESLNVVIKLLEQAPVQMGEGAVTWIKLVIPLVVHPASKVRLRAAAALELGMPLLLEKQQEVAAIVEPMMSSKLIPEMQKLFSTKNESNVLKLWPLFVKLLGKLLHKGGAFINSLLYLEELGFRSSSPSIKKIAFIAWKSLIDNFALNPDILCSSKRLKLLMQPLSSILVRTEALLLTKLEVWWYLVVKLGPNLSANFEQVGVPLLLSTIPADASLVSPATPARSTSQSNGIGLVTPKPGVASCSSPGPNTRLSLNSSASVPQSYSSIQLLGLEMLLHYFLGSQASAAAAKSSLPLSLEPLTHNLLSSNSFFSKHSSTLISAVRDGFISVGKDAPEALLNLIWSSLVGHVNTTVEAAGNKKERQGSEVLTLLLQALQSIVSSEALPAPRALALLEATVKAIPQKVLGSAAYQVANMDVLNGTPALFLILLFYKSSMLSSFVTDERFFVCLETLVSCGLCGPTSPLAFAESVLGTVSGSVETVENKEHLWRMWSVVVNPLTDTITQTNEVNQGDALEHNFSAIHSTLMFPIIHLLPDSGLPQMTQKTMLSTWSRLYKAFARCSALVATAEENICCEELCARVSAALDGEALKSLFTLDAVANILLSIIESVDFSPFTPQFQQKMKSPHTPLGWVRKRNKALGNLSNFHVLLVQSLEVFLTLASSGENSAVLSGIGTILFSIVSILFTNLALPTVIHESLAFLTKPLGLLYGQVGSSEGEQKTHSVLGSKLEKLVGDVLGNLQTRSALQYDDELLEVLCPLLCVLFQHKGKQIRSVITQFWNATFGNAVVLTYPESLRPILSQAKQKSPLILPGFQAVDNIEDFSGQCSSECSQLDAKISGITVTSVGKRESLLTRAAELKERSSGTPSKPVSVKLDFGSPKLPRKEVLEEEASVDFVFIPPEAKERVLTEHQKEVKRTKRVDIPVMYNNLDASLDTTAFTQYTQSQEESMDKFPTHEQTETKKVAMTEPKDLKEEASPVSDDQKVLENSPDTIAQDKATNENNQTTEGPSSADVTNLDASELNDSASHKESQSPNVSGSSDMISGTPPKPNSRRQSFITLEKYGEGRPASSPSVEKFTGPLTRTSCSQEPPKSQNDSKLLPPASYSQPETGKDDPKESTTDITKDSSDQSVEQNMEIQAMLKPAKCSSEGTEDEDDVIPDTQTQELKEATDTGNKSSDKFNEDVNMEIASPGGESDVAASQDSCQVELRRSGRRRSRPILPGEESDQESKSKQQKKAPVKTLTSNDAQTSTPVKKAAVLPTRTRRSRVLEENLNESGKLQDSEQKDEQRDSQEPSQAASLSQGRSRSRSRSKEANQTELSDEKQSSSQTDDKNESPLSQSDSPSNSRPVRRTRVSNANVDVSDKRKRSEDSQLDSPVEIPKQVDSSASDADNQSPGRPRRARRSDAAEAQNKDKPGHRNEGIIDPSPAHTPTLAKGKSGRRKKAEEEMSNINKDTTPSGSGNSEYSEGNEISEIQDNSQGFGKYRTRRSSQALMASVETSESDGSDTRDRQRPKRAKGLKSSEVMPSTVVSENAPVNILGKKDAVIPSVPMDTSKNESEACLGVGPLNEVQDIHKADDKDEPPVAEGQMINSSDLKSAANEQQSDKETIMQKNDSDLKESLNTALEQRDVEKETLLSPLNSLQLPAKVELKAPELRTCPHSKRGRGRRRSTNCNCLQVSSTSSKEQCSNSQDVQDIKENKVPLESSTLVSEAELNSITSVLPEKESEALQDGCPDVANVQSSPTLPNLPEAEVPTESPVEKHNESVSEFSDVNESTALAEEHHKDNVVDGTEDKLKETEHNTFSSENTFGQEQTLDAPSAPGVSPSQSQPVQEKPFCQEQTESPVSQEEMVRNGEKSEMTEKEEPVLSEFDSNQEEQDDGEATQIDKDLQAETAQPCEASVPPQTAAVESGLDSPPKQKSSDSLCSNTEVRQSPSNSVTRGVWSPSASPSTSILKKGQKRQCEEDSPSPLIKSRRVSFANPIYQQELADDIDRRSPVIRTSSPKSKATGQPKYITTPTKGLLTLSPRNLRSPGYKSSKKCLISEMSQEPRPIPKDCVYPALVCCSTPVEAVLPQISSSMWPRGFGQLVRARNIKTVGDLSALSPNEIKSLPIRSPKVSNLKKALKTYHEQQRKGRPDDLKSFDEMEKMTSEPEETAAPNQEEDQMTGDGQEVISSEVEPTVEQKQEEPMPVEILSDVASLGARLTQDELGRCSPRELGLMHEQLSGMMRSIVDHLQSRLIRNLEDSLS